MSVMNKSVSVPLPAIVATILSILLGGAQAVLTGHIITIPEQWREMGIVLIAFFAAEGIDPIVGGNAYAALKLPAWLTHLIAAILAALMTIATSASLPHLAAAIAAGVVTVASGMGFQPLSAAEHQAVESEPEPEPEPVVVAPVVPAVLPIAAPDPHPLAEAKVTSEGFDTGVVR